MANHPGRAPRAPMVGAKAVLKPLGRVIRMLFQDYPATLLSGGRGTGWDWAADGVNSTDGFEPRFKLGTAPAGVARIIYLLIGRVDGRFVATQVNPAQTSTTGGEA